MKHYITFLFILFIGFANTAEAQKKFPLVEHFSNTECYTCQNSRTGIYETLDKYTGEVNHLTIHWKSPYPNCQLYQFNTEDSDQRVEIYTQSVRSISGTPVLSVNADPRNYSNLDRNLKDAEDDAVLVGLNMKESGSSNRKAVLEVSNLTNTTMDNLYVYAAMVEKEVVVTAYNTKKDYEIHDVFRKFMGDNGGYGEPVGSLSAGTSQTLTLEAAIPNGLESQDIYVVAWVEERKPTLDSRYEIIIHNSVSQTTSTITNNELAIPDADLSIYPNPASDVLILNNVSEFQPHSIRIMDAAGREVKNMSTRQRIQIQDLQVGQYFLILEDDAHQVIRKFIKQ